MTTTEYSLVKKSGAKVSFFPGGVKVRVVTAWPDGDTVTATLPVETARKMWASEVKFGAEVVKAAPPAPEKPDCTDPEYHDGEECTCGKVYYAPFFAGGNGGWYTLTGEE